MVGAIVALSALFPIASLASDGRDPERTSRQKGKQAGEDLWVPSLAITSGATIQEQHGSANSLLKRSTNPNPVPLRGPFDGDDLAVAPFVGASLEVMTPALPMPTRPRLFLTAEILPTFASERALALDGDPDCVRGSEPGDPCARDEDGSRVRPFGEDAINGQGTEIRAEVDDLVFGASLGVAFPLRIGKRQLRIKPSVGWIHYKLAATGFVVDGACDPQDVCTDTNPPAPSPPLSGFLRETILSASESKHFNGIGPGLDVEMDTGRFGPVGASLFLGARAYYVLGDRRITFGTAEAFMDQLGDDVAFGIFEAKVDPWMYRAHVGIRFQWLGSED